MPLGLEDSTWAAFMRGVVRGAYYMLLGAGASREGLDSLGHPLPLSRELADDLIEEFSLPAALGSLDLTRAYEAAARRARGRNYPSVDDYLHERFVGCRSPEWFQHIVRMRWRRIYTLNIDDTLDHAYVQARTARIQKPRVTHWSHPFFDLPAPDDVAIVHLHGRARLLEHDDDENNLVFGLEQYFDATSAHHAWHRIFGDTFSDEPFLVIGATLSQEIDLAQILRRGNVSLQSRGMPSLVVLPHIDAIRQEELREYGLVPIEASGGEFFEAVARAIPEFTRELPVGHGERPTAQAIRFLAQFRRLELTTVEERDRHHDLYAGHEPTWQDIVRGRDARFEEAGALTTLVTESLNGERVQRYFCLHGGPFTGKTVTLLRAAKELITSGNEVYLFVGEDRVDIDALRWWLQRSGRTVLVFDGLADFGADLAGVAERIELDAVRLAVIGTEREVRMQGLAARLPAQLFVGGDVLKLSVLSDGDINALITVLREAGRLGRITQRDRGGQLVYFRREHQRELFPAMANLEKAQAFAVRLRQLWDALARTELRSAYAACAMVHTLGYAAPIPLVAAASGIGEREIFAELEQNEALAELLAVSRGRLKTRQRALAALFIEDVMTPAERFAISASLAQSIAAYVTPETIAQRTVHARIAGQLMDERNVRRWVGRAHTARWYDTQADAHGWNARFWEQRALAATDLEAWERAESYAEQAVDILADAFTLNTLGTTLLRKAIAETEQGSEARWDYYRRASPDRAARWAPRR